MKQEFVQVPVELVREIRAVMARPVNQLVGGGTVTLGGTVPGDLRRLLEALPTPKPDVVEECAKAWSGSLPERGPIGPLTLGAMRAALRRYREVKGMDRDPELDE